MRPVKVIWMMAGMIRQVDYFDDEKQAERVILNSRNRRWGTAMMLFWSETLGRYVSVPGDKERGL